MAIAVTCTRCGKGHQVPEQFAGRRGRCKHCGHTLMIPGPAADPGPAGAEESGTPGEYSLVDVPEPEPVPTATVPRARPADPPERPRPPRGRAKVEVEAGASGSGAGPAGPWRRLGIGVGVLVLGTLAVFVLVPAFPRVQKCVLENVARQKRAPLRGRAGRQVGDGTTGPVAGRGGPGRRAAGPRR